MKDAFLQPVKPGDPITAELMNRLIRAATPTVSGPNVFADALGVHHRQKRAGKPTVWWGTLDSELTQGSSGVVSILKGEAGTTLVDSGENLTAWDQLLNAGETLATGTVVKIEWFGTPYNGWFVTAAGCAPP